MRDWLKDLPSIERKAIGEDIKTVQFGWPLGMPLVRKMGKDLWEVRIHLQTRIARVLFTVKPIQPRLDTLMADRNLALWAA